MEDCWEFEWANEKTFEKERKENEIAHEEFLKKWNNRKDYLENSKVLKEALDDFEKLLRNYKYGGREGYYYALKKELNQADSKIRQKLLSIDEFQKKQSNKIMFFEINLSKIPVEKQKEFLENPLLKKYKNFLLVLFENSKHILSEEAEKILSLKTTGSYELWVQMVEGLLSKEIREVINEDGEKVSMNYTQLINLMRSTNKSIRDNANIHFEDIMNKYEEIAEVELNAILENAKINDELRKYTRADEGRIKEDFIDVEFIESILEAVKENFSLSHRYFNLLAKLIGQEKIGYHERNVNLFNNAKKYSYSESVELLKKVFLKLDKEFLEIFEKMIAEKRIDVFPKPGKNGGAFCISFRLNDPTYVLLNHTENLRDVTTMAHEMGHAINDYLMKKKENSLNFAHPKSTAEVASTFMEDFIFEEILKKATDKEKFYLILTKIGEDIQTIHRQIAMYLFELEIHKLYRKDGYLPKEKIEEIFIKYMGEYMGNSVDMQTGKLGWVYWSHIRMYFYVYSYASGVLISKAMQAKYRADPTFIDKIKEFLSTGTSKTPKEIFEEMGIKINKEFFSLGLKEIEKQFKEVEDLGRKLGFSS